uniref:Uncharacterized protein n=1 Tax=Leersia perrieri TaxID=77586 RepID=A0A0D9WWU6_9ORYZ
MLAIVAPSHSGASFFETIPGMRSPSSVITPRTSTLSASHRHLSGTAASSRQHALGRHVGPNEFSLGDGAPPLDVSPAGWNRVPGDGLPHAAVLADIAVVGRRRGVRGEDGKHEGREEELVI